MRFHNLIRVLLVMLALGCCRMSFAASAESTSDKRWLIVLETSSSMQRRKDGALQALDSLFASRMAGQLATGDTIGVWTFNSQVSTGQLPLKRWSRETAEGVRSDIVDFGRQHAFERPPDISQVVTAVSQLVSNSPVITVVIIGSGEGTVSGTPFDGAINDTWALWRTEQQKARMPIITVLRGFHGKMVAQSVSPAQYPLELPPLPPEPVRQMKPDSKVTQEPKPALPEKPVAVPKSEIPRTQALPLIVTGNKHQPQSVAPATNAPAPLSTNTGPALANVQPTINNTPQVAQPTNATSVRATATNLTAKTLPMPSPAAQTQFLAKIPEPIARAPISSGTALPQGELQQKPDRQFIWVLAAGVAVPLVLLIAWILVRAFRRKPAASSLITESLEGENRH